MPPPAGTFHTNLLKPAVKYTFVASHASDSGYDRLLAIVDGTPALVGDRWMVPVAFCAAQ